MKILSTIVCLTFSLSALALRAGDATPDVSAKNQDGKEIKFSAYKGQFVLLYFYPKDETPGCTKEACSLRDEFAKIKALNTVVFGASAQDQKSHQEFKSHHKLPFDLLVDSDGKLAQAFGAEKIPLVGLHKRQSVLIGPDGKILKFYKDVDPEKHTDEVIADIKKAGPPQATK